MLFRPTLNYSIIPEEEFSTEILNIEKELSNYAVTGTFNSFDNHTIAYEYFLVENPKASVILLHGFTEFYKKLYEMAWYFINMGYNVFMYDQRDHGLSERSCADTSITHIDDFNNYVLDLEYFVDNIVTPNSKNLPIHIMGHSMGGAVTTLYLMRDNNPIKKAILSSPMISPKTHGFPSVLVNFVAKKYGRREGYNAIFPHSKPFNPNPDFVQSSDASAARFLHNLDYRLKNPCYQNSAFSNGWIREALKVKKLILNNKSLAKIKARTLIISAENDKVVHQELHYKLAKKLKTSTIVTMPGAKHTVYTASGPELESFYKIVFDYIEE